MAINLTIPTSWNDLTANQVKKIAGILSNNTSGKKLDLHCFFNPAQPKMVPGKKVVSGNLGIKAGAAFKA